MRFFDASLLRAAHAMARVIDPIQVYEKMGALPHRTASHEPYTLQTHNLPAPFVGPPPLSIHAPESWEASAARAFALAQTVLLDAGFASREGNVYDARGRLLPGASHKYRDLPRLGWVPRPYTRTPAIERLEGQVAVLTAHGQDTYFHWLFDVLPRLARLELESHRPDHLYARAERPFQRETLALLGVDPAAIVECATRPFITADELLVPCHEIARGRVFPAWVIEWLRGRLLERALVQSEYGRGERIYIARSGTRHRNVSNQAELEKHLAQRGFATVRLEAMPVAEQVRCFHEARVVVAPHGSGLANLVFCKPGARVIELFPGRPIDLYYRLCHATGLRHAYLTTAPRSSGLGRADYAVDLAALEATFELLAE